MSDDIDGVYIDGHTTAAAEIAAGTTSHDGAKERGLHPRDQDARIAWDCGYEDAVCAYRLGEDPATLAADGLYDVSTMSVAHVIEKLLDGTWGLPTRPDPRKAPR